VSEISNQFSFPLEVCKITVPLYFENKSEKKNKSFKTLILELRNIILFPELNMQATIDTSELTFLNSLMIHQVSTKEIMTMTDLN